VTAVDRESEAYKKAMQKLHACTRNDLKGDTSSRTTRSTKPKVQIQCIAHVLAIKHCAAGWATEDSGHGTRGCKGKATTNDKTAKDK
jgi:hypothetical protein